MSRAPAKGVGCAKRPPRSPRRERPYLTLNCTSHCAFADRVAALRPCARLVYRRDRKPHRILRGRLGRYAVPRRDRRVATRSSTKAVAGTGERGVPASAKPCVARAALASCRHQPRPAHRDPRGAVPSRPLPPPERFLQVPPLRELGEDRLLMLEHHRRLFAHRSGRPRSASPRRRGHAGRSMRFRATSGNCETS